MPRKLSETRIRILKRLASRDLDQDGAGREALAQAEARPASSGGERDA